MTRCATGAWRLAIAALPLLMLSGASATAGPLSYEGTAPWEVCGLCHGYEGKTPRSKFPRLAGQKPDYIIKQLKDFASGKRENGGGQMSAVVTEVSPDDYAAIAEWFASREPAPPDAPEGDAALGAELFKQKSCGVCHLAPEPPTRPLIPRITAQHERYVAKQLRDFRDGARANDVGGVMRLRAKTLTDDEIEALAAHLASRPRS